MRKQECLTYLLQPLLFSSETICGFRRKKFSNIPFWQNFTNVSFHHRSTDRTHGLVIMVMTQRTGSGDPSPNLRTAKCGQEDMHVSNILASTRKAALDTELRMGRRVSYLNSAVTPLHRPMMCPFFTVLLQPIREHRPQRFHSSLS